MISSTETVELASAIADVSGVDIDLNYMPVGGSGTGTIQAKIIGLGGGATTLAMLPGRWVTTWTPQTVMTTVCNGVRDRYRFGMNTQEKLNSIAGIGNHTTALFWEYDARLGRRWNIDPKPETSLSVYSVYGGNPILRMDILGDTPTVSHREIMNESAKWRDPEPGKSAAKWSNTDIVQWKTLSGDAAEKFIIGRKAYFINHYRNAMKAAAKKYNIHTELLAGIALKEYGGAPSWIDDAAYWVREDDCTGTTKSAVKTSFGNLSIQVVEAAKTLGYNPATMTSDDKQNVIASLEDPIQNIFIAGKHLSELKVIDYKNVETSRLTVDQVQNITTRFNRGREASLESIKKNNLYGRMMLKFTGVIVQALKGN